VNTPPVLWWPPLGGRPPLHNWVVVVIGGCPLLCHGSRRSKSPLEPRLVTVSGETADQMRATPTTGWAAANESIPPGTWTESGPTLALVKSPSSRDQTGGTELEALAMSTQSGPVVTG
jgi:hypothetical protein